MLYADGTTLLSSDFCIFLGIGKYFRYSLNLVRTFQVSVFRQPTGFNTEYSDSLKPVNVLGIMLYSGLYWSPM